MSVIFVCCNIDTLSVLFGPHTALWDLPRHFTASRTSPGRCYSQPKPFKTLPPPLPLAVLLSSRCQTVRVVQAAVLRLLQPFSAYLDEASVNTTERLHRSFFSAIIGCSVVLLPPHIFFLDFFLYVCRKIRKMDRMLTEVTKASCEGFLL